MLKLESYRHRFPQMFIDIIKLYRLIAVKCLTQFILASDWFGAE